MIVTIREFSVLKLNDFQTNARRRDHEAAFVDRLVKQLRNALAEAGRPEKDVTDLTMSAQKMLAAARCLGFDTEAQVTQFASTMIAELELSNLAKLPRVALRVLRDSGIDRYERLDQFQVWAETKCLRNSG